MTPDGQSSMHPSSPQPLAEHRLFPKRCLGCFLNEGHILVFGVLQWSHRLTRWLIYQIQLQQSSETTYKVSRWAVHLRSSRIACSGFPCQILRKLRSDMEMSPTFRKAIKSHRYAGHGRVYRILALCPAWWPPSVGWQTDQDFQRRRARTAGLLRAKFRVALHKSAFEVWIAEVDPTI